MEHLSGYPADDPFGVANPATDASDHAIGPINFVRNDDSASSVNASQVDTYAWANGQWVVATGKTQPIAGEQYRITRFPGEPWPPIIDSPPE